MEKRIIFRLTDEMHEQLNEAVRQGKAKNTSELIRTALSEFLTKLEAKEEVSE